MQNQQGEKIDVGYPSKQSPIDYSIQGLGLFFKRSALTQSMKNKIIRFLKLRIPSLIRGN